MTTCLAARLDGIAAALDALRSGRPVLVVDDEHRENEGDVIMAAATASPAWVGWTVRHTSGVLCAPMPDDVADRLGLPLMVARNQDARGTAYTVSVDARRGVGTGISATDRATTLRLLADPEAGAEDLSRPGHVFPLRAKRGGVIERPGHTEAAVDLCRLAGLPPVGVIAEVVGDDGELLRLVQLRLLADQHELPLISIADLAAYRLDGPGAGPSTPALDRPALNRGALNRGGPAGPGPARVERVTETVLPTRYGLFRAVGYRDCRTGDAHLALVTANAPATGALVRVHSECLTGDSLGSQRCDCGPQLEAALARVAQRGGAVVYLRGHEGRGIGLLAKLEAYALQDTGLDTVAANTVQGLPADAREYGAAAAILADLGLGDVSVLTNNPEKVLGLVAHGATVRERTALEVASTAHNRRYLLAKRDLMGHTLELETSE